MRSPFGWQQEVTEREISCHADSLTEDVTDGVTDNIATEILQPKSELPHLLRRNDIMAMSDPILYLRRLVALSVTRNPVRSVFNEY